MGEEQQPHETMKPLVVPLQPVEEAPIRCSQRARRPTLLGDYVVYMGEADCDIRNAMDLVSCNQAMSCPQSFEWLDAMKDEIQSMFHNDVRELMELFYGFKPIDSFQKKFIWSSLKVSKRVIRNIRFVKNKIDQCIYLKVNESKFIFFLYVDDILLASSDINVLHETKSVLSKAFDMKDLGKVSFVLGIKIHGDRPRGVLELSQKAYIERVLAKFNMQGSKPGDVPIIKGEVLSKKSYPKNEIKRKSMKNIPNASAIGSLMYAQVYTRLDIAFAIMEAEFMAYHKVAAGIVIKNFISGLLVVDSISRPMLIYCDNSAIVFFPKNNKNYSGSKRIEIKYLAVKDMVKRGDIVVEHLEIEAMIADPLTKGV
uniref:Uncharacterized protein LOC105033231 n=1 Tax=Elaeis guineensis var. tenera TaxID=51953 RepID=A0A6I9QBX8_ELAGV|nr:uncharacterized protein LOC105033231 [Elaeis guineensis]